jgi:transcriptional regulator with XRE-family HTH domain
MHYYDIKKCGARIRQLRIQHGYTQEKLAGELNIDRSLLSHIESGKRGCSVDLLVQLADFFHVSLDLLILGAKQTVSAKEAEWEVLKADIAELICQLEVFQRKL